jgi:YhcG PDDEXK nuclease domain
LFYHRILKCFVLIDLKRGEIDHNDVGQMNLYLNYSYTYQIKHN